MATTTTDRDRWADPAGGLGLFGFSLVNNGRLEDVRDGLKAFAAAWFDCYEDEDDLPPAWWRLKGLAEDIFAEDLFPEDEEDE